MDLQNTINEVHRKIGRNLLLIQKLEYQLKYIVLHSIVSGHPSELNDIKNTREENLSKMSMGQVLNQYLDHVNPSKENNQEIPSSNNDIHMTIEYTYDISKEKFEEKEKLLLDIRNERNDLVHHLILEYNEKSIDSLKNIEHKLDEQKNRLLPELKNLHNIIEAMKKATNLVTKLIKSDQSKRISYIHSIALDDKILFLELAKLSIKNHKSNGWVNLGYAGKHIRNKIPKEFNNLNNKYGYKTLKPLIQNIKFFELKEDISKNIILYKLKDEWREDFKNFYIENNVESKDYWQTVKID